MGLFTLRDTWALLPFISSRMIQAQRNIGYLHHECVLSSMEDPTNCPPFYLFFFFLLVHTPFLKGKPNKHTQQQDKLRGT